MPSKILLKRALLVIVGAGIVFSLVLLARFFFKNSILNGSVSPVENGVVFPKPGQVNFGLPVRLKIPRIDVDAAIEYVGITSQGAMAAPKDPDNVGWFEVGPRPGERGSAVIDGHYGRWLNGNGSVFDSLHRLAPGDKVYVEDDTGVTIPFVVREGRRYDPKADAKEVFGSNDGKAHLNLITCDGVWDNVYKSYSKRLVVFTDRE